MQANVLGARQSGGHVRTKLKIHGINRAVGCRTTNHKPDHQLTGLMQKRKESKDVLQEIQLSSVD